MSISKRTKGKSLAISRKMVKRFGKNWKSIYKNSEIKLHNPEPEERLETHVNALTEEEQLMAAIFALTVLEETLIENGNEEALEALEESMDSLLETADLMPEVNDVELEEDGEIDYD